MAGQRLIPRNRSISRFAASVSSIALNAPSLAHSRSLSQLSVPVILIFMYYPLSLKEPPGLATGSAKPSAFSDGVIPV